MIYERCVCVEFSVFFVQMRRVVSVIYDFHVVDLLEVLGCGHVVDLLCIYESHCLFFLPCLFS